MSEYERVCASVRECECTAYFPALLEVALEVSSICDIRSVSGLPFDCVCVSVCV